MAVKKRRPSGKRSARGRDQKVDVAGVSLSSPSRLIYPDAGITKLELARYYESMGDWLLPHFRDRPLTLVRCPDTYQRCFFQKHIDNSPFYRSLHVVPIREESGIGHYAAADSLEGVLSLVQLGTVEFHTFGCRRDRIEQPDRFVLDLDPGESVSWAKVVRAAQVIRELLAELDLESFVKTTGGNGLHVVVPLQRRRSWSDVLAFSRALAGKLVSAAPAEFTDTVSKAKRRGKILVDYLRNARGSIVVEAYSARARAGATVSTPLAWDELSASLTPDRFTVRTVPKRLASLGADPWAGYASVRQSITAAALKRAGAGTESRNGRRPRASKRAARRGASRTGSSRSAG